MSRIAYSKLLRFLEARITPGGEFGLHMTAGLAMLVAAVAIFRDIAEEVGEQDDIARFDVHVAQWFNTHAFEPLTTFMLGITHLHGIVGMSIASTLLAVWFWRRKAQYWLLSVAITVPCGMLINVLLKNVYARPRPMFDEPLLTLSTYSFPSGHTSASTLFYGLIACYVFTTSPSWRRRCTAMVLAAMMVLLVAFSRVYLGAHYVSDVLAAMAYSAGWLAVCIASVSTLRRRRLARRDE
ncbi:phosphatase PAP2 family protein [Pseudoduganella umbonata]|uniref:Phosphatase PAP2 family protein n=1 Tax=Pseudoduganella umbonata TaxID=864828 RepID=A0A4P8HVI5_9BURK|nr:phosphatase PAP2 family protein [Pseudoduganella umbonata]MBB3224076.1 undecaprenyl-diphosphatase [Pseudoduganella umbonata]QCP14057.1 phosphatase PAP2 family protein [Pseudoduganella umbonata]